MTLHISDYEKEQQIKISDELSKYSMNVFEDFQKIFPCNGLLSMGIHYKSFATVVNGKEIISYVVLEYNYDGSHKFWRDWNRYNNLKAFL